VVKTLLQSLKHLHRVHGFHPWSGTSSCREARQRKKISFSSYRPLPPIHKCTHSPPPPHPLLHTRTTPHRPTHTHTALHLPTLCYTHTPTPTHTALHLPTLCYTHTHTHTHPPPPLPTLHPVYKFWASLFSSCKVRAGLGRWAGGWGEFIGPGSATSHHHG